MPIVKPGLNPEEPYYAPWVRVHFTFGAVAKFVFASALCNLPFAIILGLILMSS